MKPYYDKDGITIYNGDCLDIMQTLEPNSFDLVLTDPPYGTTACKWDVMPNLDTLWENLKFLSKPNSGYVLSASQPFTSKLVLSNLKWFKYELIWDKTFGRQPQLANIQPMKRHESFLIFGRKKIKYNPQKTKLTKPYFSKGASNNAGSKNDHKLGLKKITKFYEYKTPDSIMFFKPESNSKIFHPTQKPVALMEYLVKTYTDQNDLILDPFMGSGTTLVAAKKLKRRAVGIELSEQYCQIAVNRLENTLDQRTLFKTKEKKK
jgi:site-specific DNA-methyltransferase (adenine-specific)